MQVLCGTSLAVGSFGLQVWLAPYRQAEANVLKAAVDLQIFLTFLVSFVLRALDATPVSAAGLGLASFEPEFTQAPTISGGPAVFYGWILVGSLGLVLALAVGLTMSQLRRRRRWLASTARGAELQQLALQGDPAEERESAMPEDWRYSTAQLDPTGGELPPTAEMRRHGSSSRADEARQPLLPPAPAESANDPNAEQRGSEPSEDSTGGVPGEPEPEPTTAAAGRKQAAVELEEPQSAENPKLGQDPEPNA